jgi:arylformamidase
MTASASVDVPSRCRADRIGAMRLIDLSHTISDGQITYPGLPGPVISEHLTFDASHAVYDAGTEFSIGRIEMVSNTGTYLDTPGHRHRGGHDLSGLTLERCALLPALVVEGEATGATGLAAFEGLDVAGHAVLVRTRWDLHFGTEAYGAPEHPFLATEAAEWLADQGVALVGIDSVNIDDTRGGERQVHTLLLEREIPVVEHLTGLTALPPTGATFTAVPPKVAGMSTFPVRAFATLP